jgi:hypothetical protein
MLDDSELGCFLIMLFLVALLSFGIGRCSQVAAITTEAEATVVDVNEKMHAEPNWYLTARDDIGNYYAGSVQTLVRKGWRVRIKAYQNKIKELHVLSMEPPAETVK